MSSSATPPQSRSARTGWIAWLPLIVLVIVALGPGLVGERVFAAGDLVQRSAPWAETTDVTVVRNVCVADTVDSALPHQLDARERIAAGEVLPDFEGGASAGTPLTATPGTGTASPIFWASLPFPDEAFTAWVKLFEIIVAVAGTVLWARRIGLSIPAGALGGFLFVTSGFMISWTNWPQTRTAAFFPLLFWALERVLQDRTWRSVLPLPVVVAGLALGGFPAIVLHAAYVALAYALVRLVVLARDRRPAGLAEADGDPTETPARRWLAAPALALAGGGVALALIAFQLVPWAQQLAAQDLEYRGDKWATTLPVRNLLTVPFSEAVGTCASDFGFWGEAVPVEGMSFVGGAAIVLVVAGLVLPVRVARGVRGVLVVAVLVVGAASFLGGPVNEVLRHLPGLGTSEMYRMRAIGGLLVAMLAACGYDALVRDPRPGISGRGATVGRARRVLAVLALVATVLGIGTAALLTARLAPTPEHWAVIRGSVLLSLASAVVTGALAVALVLRRGVVPPGAGEAGAPAPAGGALRSVIAVLVPILIAAEGVVAARAWWPLAPADSLYAENPTTSWLRENTGGERIVGIGTAYMGSGAQAAGLRSLSGHSFVPDDWSELVAAADPEAWSSPTNMQLSGFAPLASPVLERLGVRYAVADTPWSPPGEAVGMEERAEGVPVDLAAGGASTMLPAGLTLRGVLVDLGDREALDEPGGVRTEGLACVGDTAGVGPGRDPVLTARVTDLSGAEVTQGERRLRVDERGVVSLAVDPVTAPDGGAVVTLTVSGCDTLPVVARVTEGSAPADGASTGGEPAAWLGLTIDGGDGLVPVPSQDTPGAIVYANPEALPRIRWASAAATCTGAADCARRMEGLPATTVLLDPKDAADVPFAGRPARVNVRVDADDTQVVDVAAQGDGMLVIADAVHPGWRATVDGQDVPLVVADGALRGVPVPAGRHTVVVQYEPAGRPVLLPLAAVTAVAWATLAVVLVRRSRSSRAPHREPQEPRREPLR